MKTTENKIFETFGELLKSGQKSIVIATHQNPDGDAMGSSIGLAETLQNMGHLIKIIVPNEYPEFLKWFSSNIEIVIFEKEKKLAENYFNESNLLICLDFNDIGRVAQMGYLIEEFNETKVLIDHHPHPKLSCDLIISEPAYSSTAELIYAIISKMSLDHYINDSAAEALFTGIMTDTGSFNHKISRSNIFETVSKLMERNIDTEKIHSEVYDNYSENRMNLLGYCLNKKMEVLPEYRTAIIQLTKDELNSFDNRPGDTEGFVNYPLSIKNIVFSTLFIEKNNYIKISFRSKGDFPVNVFSRENFNGGGHLNAAGGEINLSLEESIEKFKLLLDDYKDQLLNTKI